eukprot:TRINITY_DN1067_c0_g1_i7.p1 TRINITY_DN1067_c0_g1~~TRINITY_DN1067_c0_g1_i7.p1  ORF type:complete len:333 (+),score=44.06 TRINITY_DN1067_c0_g1_i7:66-1064(+)
MCIRDSFGEAKVVHQVKCEFVSRLRKCVGDEDSAFILCRGSTVTRISVSKEKETWKSKNVSNDELDLQVPIYDMDCCLDKEKKHLLYVCTGYQKVRIYDTRNPRSKPIQDILLDKEGSPFNNMSLSQCGSLLFVSNLKGDVLVLNTKKNMHQEGKLKGNSGTVKDIVLHKSQPYIATVGLDRFLRIYNTNDCQLVKRVFLKQKLNCCQFYDEELEEEKLKPINLEQEYLQTRNITKEFVKENRNVVSSAKGNKVRLVYQKGIGEVKQEDQYSQIDTKVEEGLEDNGEDDDFEDGESHTKSKNGNGKDSLLGQRKKRGVNSKLALLRKMRKRV